MANGWGIPKNIEDLVLERDQCCVYCGCEFSNDRPKKRSWEHIINDMNIRTLENIALCCIGCNASKGNKELRKWLDSDSAKKRGISYDTLADVIKTALNSDS